MKIYLVQATFVANFAIVVETMPHGNFDKTIKPRLKMA